MIGTEFAITLWFINLIEMGIISLIFVKEYKKEKNSFYLGVAIFSFLFVIARLSEVIRVYFNPTCPFGTPGCPSVPPYSILNFDFWLKTTYTCFSYIGLMIIYFALERYVFRQTKYIFTILVPITTVISIWFSIDPANYDLLFLITIPLYLLILFGIVGMYIYLAVKTTGEVRRNSIMITFGILLFELGLVFALPEAQAKIFAGVPTDILWILAPILSIIGVLLQIRGFKTSIS